MKVNGTFVALCGLLVLCTLLVACAGAQIGNQQVASTRSSFKLPKVFDFEQFKQLFHKSYQSAIAELNRKRLYLARAFQVFLSAAGYKHRLSSSYLAINEMSDWAPEELREMMQPREEMERWLDRAGVPKVANEFSEKQAEDQKEVGIRLSEINDMQDIERKLEELKHEPAFKSIADEFDKPLSAERRKREARVVEHELSADDLLRVPERTSSLGDVPVESNNPNYEPIELDTSAPVWNIPIGTGLTGLMLQQWGNTLFPYHYKEPTEDVDSFKPDEVFVDLRDDCMLMPRSQGRCGSCYAFATMSIYEWFYCKATGQKVAFSEQYIVDCGSRVGDDLNGCQGGIHFAVSQFVNKFGLELRRNYPYRMRQETCPYDKGASAASMGYLRTQDSGFEYISMESWPRELEKAPMLISVVTSNEFPYYGGGVDKPDSCELEGSSHAMLLVGHGREDNEEYWLIRNSYGVKFGERGYYKLSKKHYKCILRSAGARLRNFKVLQKLDQSKVGKEV